MRYRYSDSYGLIASCNDVSVTKDTSDGGIFTQGLSQVITRSLEKKGEKRFPYIDMQNITQPLLDHFTHEGILYHIYI
jgi:hypothetical protein